MTRSVGQGPRLPTAQPRAKGKGDAAGAVGDKKTGKAKKGGKAKGKGKVGSDGVDRNDAVGISYVDAYEDDEEQRKRRKQVLLAIGEEETEQVDEGKGQFVANRLETVDQEYRFQLSKSLARAGLHFGGNLADAEES